MPAILRFPMVRLPEVRLPVAPRPLALLSGLLMTSAALAGCGEADGGSPGEAPAETSARSLAEPPDLQVGEWWRVEVDPALVGQTFEVTLVVTDVEDGTATLGIAPDDFQHDFLLVHVPPLGDLELATMAWRVMWDDFEALRFPLEEGASWEADFHGSDVVAQVTRVEGDRAWVSYSGEDQIELVYDARAGMITEFQEERLRLGFRVVEHGTGYTGPVRAMSRIRLGYMAMGPADPISADVPGSGRSSSTYEVASGSQDGTLSFAVWNLGVEDQPGRYRIVATAPDGTVFDETFETEAGSPSVIPLSFPHRGMDGTWQIDFERDGPARLLVELFTYDLEVVELDRGGSVHVP